ncbi:hypothetical protein IPM19_01135 [bacterium]|nr:MAG: hypothetical protein IPM19_01135 [bacterium]
MDEDFVESDETSLIAALDSSKIAIGPAVSKDVEKIKFSKSFFERLIKTLVGLLFFAAVTGVIFFAHWLSQTPLHTLDNVIIIAMIVMTFAMTYKFTWDHSKINKTQEEIKDKLFTTVAIPLANSIENHNSRVQELIDIVNIQSAFDETGENTKLLVERIHEKLPVIQANRERLERIHSKYEDIRGAHKNTIASLQLTISDDALLSSEEMELNHLAEVVNGSVQLQTRNG